MGFVYKGLAATLEKVTVTDAEVEQQLVRLQQQNPRLRPVVGRRAQSGDELVLDYAGTVDGVAFAGGTAQGQTLVLGSGMFIPGFEEQLIGSDVGEQVTVQVTFPADYHAKELAGKAAEFACMVHEIRERSTYELDDVFAKEVGQCGSMAQMREKLHESLQSYYDERAEMELQDKLLRQAAATLDYTPTQQKLDEAMDAQVQTMQAQLGQRGLTLEMYCQFMGTNMEQLREDTRADAEASLRIQKAAEMVAALEGLRETDEEVGREYVLLAQQNGMKLEDLKAYITPEFEEAVRRNARLKQAIAFVRAHAQITERAAAPKKE